MDSGILFLCELKNEAEPGDMPFERLHRIAKHWFQTLYISESRQFTAAGVNRQIDQRVRIHFEPRARVDQYVELGNGEQFRIINAANGYTDDGLRCTDLTLMRLEDNYDVERQIDPDP